MSSWLKDLDPVPLVERLLDKSRGGRLKWEPTADAKAFVASIGGEATFRIRLVEAEDIDEYGRPVTVEVPRLDMLDDKGRLLWDIRSTRAVPFRVSTKLREGSVTTSMNGWPLPFKHSKDSSSDVAVAHPRELGYSAPRAASVPRVEEERSA